MVHNNGRPCQPHKNAPAAGRGRGESELGSRSARFRPSSPEMTPEKPSSKSLHNFSLPPLGWGCQRVMQTVKEIDCPPSLKSEAGRRSSVPLPCHQARLAEEEDEEDEEGIGAVRVKLMSDLRTATDQFQKEVLKCHDVTEAEEEPVGKLAQAAVMAGQRVEEEAAETRPWNLRTRRSAGKALAASKGSPEKEKKREKFSVTLKRKEIQEDFMKMIGRRTPPPSQEKGRSKAVQKQLDMLFPGFWLTEVTADAYKVVEVQNKKKVNKR